LQPDEIRRLLAIHPGRSVWAPATLEYALVAPWRHRVEISHLAEISAVRHPEAIVEAAAERCSDAGDELLMTVELEEVRRPLFYDRIGFDLLEEIVTYEWDGRLRAPRPAVEMAFEPADAGDPAVRAELLALDHAAFPWLWWNSDLECQTYGLTPGVELHLGRIGGRAAAYVGITSFPGWGHLDRIAVRPDAQGQGYGQAALAFAVDRLRRRGARRVGLSTQSNNDRSRRLYERFGFRRYPGNDYRLYGRSLTGSQAT
jgi:ribosomal protein S18 acetylase RimI-like enzyme